VHSGTGDWRAALPHSRASRLLLGIGATALVLVIPLLWMWLLYASGLSAPAVKAGAIVLGALAVGTGAGMIRILDERR
jgi:hypothetical protein